MKYAKGLAPVAKRVFEGENRKMIVRALLALGGPACVKKWMLKPMNEKAKNFLTVMGRRLYISGLSVDDKGLKFFEDEQGGDHGTN